MSSRYFFLSLLSDSAVLLNPAYISLLLTRTATGVPSESNLSKIAENIVVKVSLIPVELAVEAVQNNVSYDLDALFI